MGILSEAFAHNRFYDRVNSTYSFITEILEYANINASEIISTNKKAEDAAISNVITNAGKVKKGIKFNMVPLHRINDFITFDHYLSTDSNGTNKYYRTGKIVHYDSVVYYAKFEAIKESTLPRGYIIPAKFTDVIKNLEMHGIRVEYLVKDQTFTGEIFVIDSLVNSKNTFQKHSATTLNGNFKPITKKYKKGDCIVDMAQPLTNLIFYLLEPQSDDGLVHWNFFDTDIKQKTSKGLKVEYPVFKYYKK